MKDLQPQSTLGFVGLGVMGQHMCRNLAEKTKSDIYIYDKASDASQLLTESGAISCASLTELGKVARIVFLSLPNTEAVKEVCLGASSLCSGSTRPEIIVDMGTTDVSETRAIARQLAEKGVTFIDAPVARMPEAARSGTLLIMVGANEADFSRLLPLFKTMGTDVVRCGDTGAGQIVKIINNFVLITNVNVLAEALLIGERSGVSGEQLFNTLLLGSGSSEALKVAGVRGLLPRNFAPGRFSTTYAMKDISLAKNLADAAGVHATALENVRARLQSAIDRGNGDQYYPILIDEIDTDEA